MSEDKKTIAVFGATGQQGGSVLRALQASGQFRVRALTRHPGRHLGLAEEVVEADLDRPETLAVALDGVHGAFLVTNFWEPDTDEFRQATAAVRAGKDAGVQHLVWSTLPNVEEISGGKFHVPHFTGKSRIDRVVREAGFEHHTFVIAPMYFQALAGPLAPQRQDDGSMGWALPLDPSIRGLHMGDIGDLGDIVTGAFAHPELTGHGEYLPLVGDLVSFHEIIDTLRRQGRPFSYRRLPKAVFEARFPKAVDVAESFGYFEAHTYLGSSSDREIALARKVAGTPPSNFATWAQANFAV